MPVAVPKGVRRLEGLDALVLSLYGKGMTTGDIRAHLAEIYGQDISGDTISRITDAVVEDMQAWQSRPLDAAWLLSIVVKQRSRQCAVAA